MAEKFCKKCNKMCHCENAESGINVLTAIVKVVVMKMLLMKITED
jgi:hypothetical protein